MPNTPKGLTYPSNSSPVAIPADIQELATDVDGLIVPNTGGTYTGSVSFTQSPSVPTPTSALHAVNKTYADLINTDITALETELGTNPSGTFSTVKDRLDSYTDGFSKVGNLLTANQASVETDSSPFGAFLNCTISRSTDHAAHGSACLKAIATTEGQVIAGLGVTTVPVTPGETITGTFALKADRNLTGVRITIQWATGGAAGDVMYRTVNATTAWVTHSLTVVVPAGVDTAGLFAWVTSAAPAGSEIYMDCFGIWKGAGGVWALPGTPIVGLSEVASNGAVHLSGTGVPNGVLSAAPGSSFLQVGDAVTVSGNLLWRKASGTGNAGWTPEGALADTGWRTIAYTSGDANWTEGNIIVRRVGTVVHVSLIDVKMAAISTKIITLPAGFVNLVGAAATAVVRESAVTGNPYWFTISAGQVCRWGYALTGTFQNTYKFNGTFSYTTPDAWPSSLPGSAA